MRQLLVLTLLAGCSSVLNDSDRAIALACKCSTGVGVSGSPLELSSPTVQRRGEQWSVSFREQAPRSFPSGRDLIIDLAAGTCANAIMD